jgi:hypothetical protein
MFLLSQKGTSLPEFGKKLFIQCEFQIRRAWTSSRSHTRANNSLYQLNVAQTPTHNQFVKFGEALADINPVPMAVLVSV